MEITNFKQLIILTVCFAMMLNTALAQKSKPDSISFSTPVYSISGTLSFCKSDSMVKTASVSLMNTAGKTVNQVYTDIKGFYFINWVNGGNYTLKFEWSGEQASLPVSVTSDITGKDACIPVPVPQKPLIDPTQAGSDISKGIVQLYICNPGGPLTQAMLDNITQKYGFRFAPKGSCLPSGPDQKAFDAYNATVEKYLDTKNNPGWRANVNSELQALISSLSPNVDRGGEFFLN
jgi:hypothetical protein